MRLFIKNMVSHRCKMMVRAECKKLAFTQIKIELGFVEVTGTILPDDLNRFKAALLKSGLELMDDKKAILVERIKNVVIDMVHHAEDYPVINYSNHISKQLSHDYTYLANTFAKQTGSTIQQFIIKHKIEKVKELLLYNELTLTQISYKLQYSSVAHLSTQFKKVTGVAPSSYRFNEEKRLNNLEQV